MSPVLVKDITAETAGEREEKSLQSRVFLSELCVLCGKSDLGFNHKIWVLLKSPLFRYGNSLPILNACPRYSPTP